MNWNEQGGAAFPFAATDPSNVELQSSGMSLRDWLAGQTAAAICGGLSAAQVSTNEDAAASVAKASYLMADAMLAARSAK